MNTDKMSVDLEVTDKSIREASGKVGDGLSSAMQKAMSFMGSAGMTPGGGAIMGAQGAVLGTLLSTGMKIGTLIATSVFRDTSMVLQGVGVVKGLIDQMSPYTRAANPGVNERMDTIMEQIDATIGHTLIPVMEGLMPLVRGFGDALAKALPSSEVMTKAMERMAPIIDHAVHWLQRLGETLGWLIENIIDYGTSFIEAIYNLLNQFKILDITGFGKGTKQEFLESNEDYAMRSKYESKTERYAGLNNWTMRLNKPVQLATELADSVFSGTSIAPMLGTSILKDRYRDESMEEYENRLKNQKRMATPYRQAEYKSTEDLSRQLYLAAASGTGTEKSIAQQQLDQLQIIAGNTTPQQQSPPPALGNGG